MSTFSLYCSISGLVVFTDANYNPAEIPTNSNSQNILAETIANEADFLISYATQYNEKVDIFVCKYQNR
jgi:accessory gene regulator protein AgrB